MTGNLDERPVRHFAFGPFFLMPERQVLLRDGVAVRLGGRALDILTFLVERPGELVGKRELIARVWPKTLVDESNLKVNMSSLRRVLGDAPDIGPYVATVSGRGYRFVASVDVHHLHSLLPEGGPASPRNQNLPSATARIFGRADEIEAVRADLKRSRLVSIVGAGGIGKTTVAIAVAEYSVGLLNDGVWLVDLATSKDPAMAPIAIASAIGMKTHASSVLEAVCAYLQDREMLLVLDNCEHIIEAAAECADRILAEAGRVSILATSREPLGVRGERIRRLQGLGLPPVSADLTAAEALTFPAIQLFADRATERLEWFELRDGDAPMAAEICRRLDGLALAIELAATRIDTFSVSSLLKQLDDRFRTLVGRRAGPQRQRTLTATLDWSYSLLPNDEADLLCAVSVFAGALGVGDASAIADITPIEATHKLAQLAAKSLLSSDVDTDAVAYRLLETTRAYCHQRLREAGQVDTIHRRHARHVCAVLEAASSEWAHRPAREWGERYKPVLNDLRIAIVWAETGDRAMLIELTVAGTILWNHFSLTDECRVRVLRAVSELDAAGLSGTATEMRLLTFLAGALMFTRGPTREALEASQRALEIAVALEDTDFHLRNLWMISGYEVFTGQHAAARDRMEVFLALAGEKDPSAVREGEPLFALAEFYLGGLTSALLRSEQRFRPDAPVLEDPRLARFQFETTTTYGVNLGAYQWLAGWPDRAAQTTETLVRLTLQTGHEMTIATVLVMSGCPVALWTQSLDSAHRYITMLDQIVDQHGLETWRPVALYYRGALTCAGDDTLDEGIEMLKRAMAGLDAMNQRQRTPLFLGTLADALARSGRPAEATTTIEAALDRARAQNEGWCLPEVLRIQASILTARGRRDDAEPLLNRSMMVAQEIGALSWQLRAANDLAALWTAESRAEDARSMLLPIYQRFAEGHATGDLMYASRLLAAPGQTPC